MDKLIIDSGGTKSDLVRLHDGKTDYLECAGLHPAYTSESQMTAELKRTIHFTPDEIYFYGAGCHGEEPREKIRRCFKKLYPDISIEVNDDLTGAARAHLKRSDGLIAALGTGSICGRYSEEKITERSASLGYAIGDEGSAVDLGKRALKSWFRNELDRVTSQKLMAGLGDKDYSAWMQRIYGSDKPNRELASVAGIVFREPLTLQLRDMVKKSFQKFIDRQFASLHPSVEEPVVYTGTVACSHEKVLRTVMSDNGFVSVTVEKSIIRGLAEFHAE